MSEGNVAENCQGLKRVHVTPSFPLEDTPSIFLLRDLANQSVNPGTCVWLEGKETHLPAGFGKGRAQGIRQTRVWQCGRPTTDHLPGVPGVRNVHPSVPPSTHRGPLFSLGRNRCRATGVQKAPDTQRTSRSDHADTRSPVTTTLSCNHAVSLRRGFIDTHPIARVLGFLICLSEFATCCVSFSVEYSFLSQMQQLKINIYTHTYTDVYKYRHFPQR